MPDRPEAVFTAAYERELRVSPDRQRITHRAMAWSAEYTPATLLTWLDVYEAKAAAPRTPHVLADLEVLHAARDLLAKEGALP